MSITESERLREHYAERPRQAETACKIRLKADRFSLRGSSCMLAVYPPLAFSSAESPSVHHLATS